jgi:hypothetical protein
MANRGQFESSQAFFKLALTQLSSNLKFTSTQFLKNSLNSCYKKIIFTDTRG